MAGEGGLVVRSREEAVEVGLVHCWLIQFRVKLAASMRMGLLRPARCMVVRW